jgi:pullulanase/glycogen debranching enzyme
MSDHYAVQRWLAESAVWRGDDYLWVNRFRETAAALAVAEQQNELLKADRERLLGDLNALAVAERERDEQKEKTNHNKLIAEAAQAKMRMAERERDTLRAAAERIMYEAHVTDRCVNSGAYEALRHALDAAAPSPEVEA